MLKRVKKKIAILLAVCFLLSISAAAVSATNDKLKAVNDQFTVNGDRFISNVKANDIGEDIMVADPYIITTDKGGKVSLYRNGQFLYIVPSPTFKGTDHFTYTITYMTDRGVETDTGYVILHVKE